MADASDFKSTKYRYQFGSELYIYLFSRSSKRSCFFIVSWEFKKMFHLIVQAAFSVFISLFAASFDDGVFYNNGYLSK